MNRISRFVALGALILAACDSGSTSSPTSSLPETTFASATSIAFDTATTAPATTVAGETTTSVAVVEHFSTLPVGSTLPSDATCAAEVRPMPERRSDNETANHTVGVGPTDATTGPYFVRVTGNFTGTTDELIEWAACKWGIDEDIVRAQIAKESYWHQSAGGDKSSDQSTCYESVRTTSGECPQSVGLGQVRFPYHGEAFSNGNAVRSSAYNLDYTYAVWRNCFDNPNGTDNWINTVGGKFYVPGDLWGCLGLWFSGRWHDEPAEQYISAVKDYYNSRVWESSNFQNG